MWYGSGAIVSLFNYMHAQLQQQGSSISRDVRNSMVDNNRMDVGKRRNPSKTASARKQNERQIILNGKNSREANNSRYDGKAGKTATARTPATTGTPVIVGTPATARTHAAAGTQQ